MNLRLNYTTLAILGLLYAAAEANAQSNFPPTLSDPYYAAVLPRPGAYFKPGEPGTGMFVDARPNGSIFIHLAVYDSAGKPTWYAVQDRFVPQFAYAIEAANAPVYHQWHVSDGIGSVHAPLYRTEGGQCLDCVYSEPVIEVAGEFGQASFHWTNSDHLTLDLAGVRSSWKLLPLDGDAVTQADGMWSFRHPSSDGGAIDSVVRLTPVSNPRLVPINHNGGYTAPPRPIVATDWFSMDCVESCDADFWTEHYSGVFPLDNPRFAVWFDRASGRAGIQQYGDYGSGPDHVFSHATRAFSLHPYGDTMIARHSQVPNVFSFGITPYPIEGAIVEMRRIETE